MSLQFSTAPAPICGECTLCCKVLRIDALNKPADVTCQHVCASGCRIYGKHPQTCKTFACTYLRATHRFGPEWRPDRAGFVITAAAEGALFINVDSERPESWRQRPYYSQIKAWSEGVRAGRNLVLVTVGQRAFLVFPEEDLEICFIPPGTRIDARYEDGVPTVTVHLAEGAPRTFSGRRVGA